MLDGEELLPVEVEAPPAAPKPRALGVADGQAGPLHVDEVVVDPPVGHGAQKEPFEGRLIATGYRRGKLVDRELDLRSVGYQDRTWMVSRKKVRNLGDIGNGWKKQLLTRANDDDVVGQYVDEWQ